MLDCKYAAENKKIIKSSSDNSFFTGRLERRQFCKLDGSPFPFGSGLKELPCKGIVNSPECFLNKEFTQRSPWKQQWQKE
ncbi:MAG: hypothetical protein HUN04_16170 [Desulfobacter sp.]|nr:MAG: hypothetical protein HUN04_16170 [Desulfobacter sp.]